MINLNLPSSSLLKVQTGNIPKVVWNTLNSSPYQIVPPNFQGFIFPVAFYYMVSNIINGSVFPLFLNTPYQANNSTGFMQNSGIAPGTVSGTYSMYPIGSDFAYPDVPSLVFDPNQNFIHLWQSIDDPSVSFDTITPFTCLYYVIDYNTFKPI